MPQKPSVTGFVEKFDIMVQYIEAIDVWMNEHPAIFVLKESLWP